MLCLCSQKLDALLSLAAEAARSLTAAPSPPAPPRLDPSVASFIGVSATADAAVVLSLANLAVPTIPILQQGATLSLLASVSALGASLGLNLGSSDGVQAFAELCAQLDLSPLAPLAGLSSSAALSASAQLDAAMRIGGMLGCDLLTASVDADLQATLTAAI